MHKGVNKGCGKNHIQTTLHFSISVNLKTINHMESLPIIIPCTVVAALFATARLCSQSALKPMRVVVVVALVVCLFVCLIDCLHDCVVVCLCVLVCLLAYREGQNICFLGRAYFFSADPPDLRRVFRLQKYASGSRLSGPWRSQTLYFLRFLVHVFLIPL